MAASQTVRYERLEYSERTVNGLARGGLRVAGVAGGSMLRARKHKVYGVGPRSAHIAGLPYACFLPAADLAGAEAVTIAPPAR
jgi:hypothetical protein